MNDTDLRTGERLDRVNDNLQLIQRTDGLTFGTDALLLAGYIRGKAKNAVELGSGTGILSLLLLSRKKADHVTAIELQPVYAELTERNASLNGLSDRLDVICIDVKDVPTSLAGSADFVCTNPPYMAAGTGLHNDSDKKNTARRETTATITDFCRAAAGLLRYGGRFFCVYRPDRLDDLLCAMKEARIAPKRLTMVCPDADAQPSLVLVEGRSGGGSGLTVTRNLIIYQNSQHIEFTDDMDAIYQTGCFPEERF